MSFSIFFFGVLIYKAWLRTQYITYDSKISILFLKNQLLKHLTNWIVKACSLIPQHLNKLRAGFSLDRDDIIEVNPIAWRSQMHRKFILMQRCAVHAAAAGCIQFMHLSNNDTASFCFVTFCYANRCSTNSKRSSFASSIRLKANPLNHNTNDFLANLLLKTNRKKPLRNDRICPEALKKEYSSQNKSDTQWMTKPFFYTVPMHAKYADLH